MMKTVAMDTNRRRSAESPLAPSGLLEWPLRGADRLVAFVRRRLPPGARLGAGHSEFSQLARQGEDWPLEQVQEYQLKQLRQTLIQAGNYCPYYQQSFSKAAFRPENLRRLEDLEECPLLDRMAPFVHREALRSKGVPADQRVPGPTGRWLQKGVCLPKARAFLEVQWKRAGWFQGARLAVLNDEGRAGAGYDAGRDWLVLDSGLFRPERLPEGLRLIESFAPQFVCLTPATGQRLASALAQAGGSWSSRLRGVFCGPGFLPEADKERLSGIFLCGVHCWYWPGELTVLAGQGQASRLLYFWPQCGRVEFGPPDAAGWSEIIATSFHNKVMPLIRWRTGDFARLADPRRDGDLERPWPAVSEIRTAAAPA